MTTVGISKSPASHTLRLVQALADHGWRALVIPKKGKLEANRQLIEFRTPTARLRVRFSIFAVGDRGESHRRDERRIQITTTYLSGLERLEDAIDVVLGHDRESNIYVGLDPRRLEFGGEKHNASSSVDPIALKHASKDHIDIRPHDTQILGLEYQAMLRPERLTEYIFNIDAIHRGQYLGNGQFSDSPKHTDTIDEPLAVAIENQRGNAIILRTSWTSRPKQLTKPSWVASYEAGDWDNIADLSPDEFEALRRKCCEIGDRGEYFALRSEKQRLRKSGRADLAAKIDWVSRRAIGKGYDIKSFELDGKPRLIEVKSTVGSGMTFFMSDKEWRIAAQKRQAYYIYRMVNVDKEPLLQRVVRDPVVAEEKQKLERVASGWKIALKGT